MEIDKNFPTNRTMRTEAEDGSELVANSDVISLETVINMLVKKNICSVEELFRLEGKVREQNRNLTRTTVVSTENSHNSNSRHHGLKKAMSKHRWTRRLGTALFGWKWKKVKKSPNLI